MWKRLLQKEDGNVLYMTIVMMMVLVMFTLVLTNTIYIAAMKVRAQNAADNMALSAATLKARVLNELANYNSAIRILYKIRGTQVMPFLTEGETGFWFASIVSFHALMIGHLVKHNYDVTHSDDISEIAKANGLDEATTELRLFPNTFKIEEFVFVLQDRYVITPRPPFYQIIPLFPAHMEHRAIQYVQSRVVWQTRDMIIGNKLLGIKPPDIVTRARAEIVDVGILQSPLGRNWRVRLAEPRNDVDAYMKNY